MSIVLTKVKAFQREDLISYLEKHHKELVPAEDYIWDIMENNTDFTRKNKFLSKKHDESYKNIDWDDDYDEVFQIMIEEAIKEWEKEYEIVDCEVVEKE